MSDAARVLGRHLVRPHRRAARRRPAAAAARRRPGRGALRRLAAASPPAPRARPSAPTRPPATPSEAGRSRPTRVVFQFFRELIRDRRRMFVALVLLNGLAAGLGAGRPRAPRRPGQPHGRPGRRRAQPASRCWSWASCARRRSSRSWPSAPRPCSARTCWRRRASTSSARILRLPVGQVESASTGDLVTRVTRDVGTMSRAVQYGLPMAIISLLTVAMSVGRDAAQLVLLAVPSLLVIGTQLRRRAQLPADRSEGLHHRGLDVLPHQHDADRDRRGRAHRGGARALRPPGGPGRRRHRGVGAGRALHDVAAQPAVRRHRRRLQHPAGGHPRRGRVGLLPGLASTWARSRPPCCTSRR